MNNNLGMNGTQTYPNSYYNMQNLLQSCMGAGIPRPLFFQKGAHTWQTPVCSA